MVEEDRRHFELLIFGKIRETGGEKRALVAQAEFLHAADGSLSRFAPRPCAALAADADEAPEEAAALRACAVDLAAALTDFWNEKSRQYTSREVIFRGFEKGTDYQAALDRLRRELPRAVRLELRSFRQGEVRLALTYDGSAEELRQRIGQLSAAAAAPPLATEEGANGEIVIAPQRGSR
jgi:hypothetical protein